VFLENVNVFSHDLCLLDLETLKVCGMLLGSCKFFSKFVKQGQVLSGVLGLNSLEWFYVRLIFSDGGGVLTLLGSKVWLSFERCLEISDVFSLISFQWSNVFGFIIFDSIFILGLLVLKSSYLTFSRFLVLKSRFSNLFLKIFDLGWVFIFSSLESFDLSFTGAMRSNNWLVI